MAETGVTTYEEVDILDPSAPAEIIGWGSPTVLINGQDVGGGRKGDSPSCRVYSSPSDVPTVAAIVSAIKRRAS